MFGLWDNLIRILKKTQKLKLKKKNFSFPYLNNVLYILAQYSSKNIARTY